MLDKSYDYPMSRQHSDKRDSDTESRHLLECTRPVVYPVSQDTRHLKQQTYFPVGRPGPVLTGESSSIMLSTSSPF